MNAFRPLLTVDPVTWTWDFAEVVGLTHAPQVVAVPMPVDGGDLFALRDGEHCASLQRSRITPDQGFLHLPAGLPAGSRLRFARVGVDSGGPVAVRDTAEGWELGNGRFALRVIADGAAGGADGIHPGPVRAMRVGDGPWRGRTFLDTRSAACRWSCTLEERGPLRARWRGRADLGNGRWYELAVTVDADAPFARIEERSAAGTGDQVVWDFTGADLPSDYLQTDTGAGHAQHRLHWGIDRRLARLAPWTQCSQLADLADGFAVAMPGGDCIGAVTLAGGTWRGRRLDHLEAWVRRFRTGDEPARRSEPPEAKADLLHPDAIPARGVAQCAPHLCWEGWIGRAERTWALVLAPLAAIAPRGGPAATVQLSHFDHVPMPEAWRAQQGLLRRIHIQHGVMPLQEQFDCVFDLPAAAEPAEGTLRWPHPMLAAHREFIQVFPRDGGPDAVQAADDYLLSRVHGFWEGSGCAHTNVVVGRLIVPRMLFTEWLQATGGASPERLARWRIQLAFLAHLFASDHFYPGDATMRPLGDDDGTEPTLQGMANQNFLTDALCVPGMFAEVFPHHPLAESWRSRAADLWSRQLDFHVYPDSGVWEESHTYFQHVVNTVLPWLLRRTSSGGPDGFADPRLRAILASGLRQLAPRDAELGGRRAMVPFGDHHPDPTIYGAVWAACVPAVAPHDPVLAGHLAWMAAEMGASTALLAVAPPLGDDHLEGLGVFLRSHGPDGAETLLALRSGGAWGHHHADDGGIVLYGAGQVLIGDAAQFHPPAADGRRKFLPEGHSRWIPAGLSPRNHLYRFTRGHCVGRGTGDGFAWALAWSPVALVEDGSTDGRMLRHPLHHCRLVVRIGDGAWLVSDRWSGGGAGGIHFHCVGSAQVDGPVARCGRLAIRALLPVVDARIAGTDHSRDRPTTLTTDVVFHHAADAALSLITLGDVEVGGGDGTFLIGGRRIRVEHDHLLMDDVRIPRWAPQYPQ